ncbi:energy transducer TonB [Xanthomonas perforans]|uniref:energy transducer TonB n=1 Tax=Xanthomonas perforans TaxID=442694 RepID=UPI001F194956|nr:energy transducer TonB [Xanthomonas perforans]MCF6086803.1 energy transducer TonB [Xanthomonas perforans]
MTEQLVIHRHDYDAGNQGLSWARIIGIAFVIALHLTALMMLLIPAVAPKAPAEKERTTMVTLVDAPPPPPPPEAPVVDVPEPRPSDIVTPPSPPSPPAPPSDIGASVDISSKNMNPPKYPPAAFRAGVQGEVILIVDVDASGNVTNVSVEKSSRNRDLDRAAMDAARKWKFNASTVNGQKAAGRVRVPVNFALN